MNYSSLRRGGLSEAHLEIEILNVIRFAHFGCISTQSLTFVGKFVDSQLASDFGITVRLSLQRIEERTQHVRQRRVTDRY